MKHDVRTYGTYPSNNVLLGSYTHRSVKSAMSVFLSVFLSSIRCVFLYLENWPLVWRRLLSRRHALLRSLHAMLSCDLYSYFRPVWLNNNLLSLKNTLWHKLKVVKTTFYQIPVKRISHDILIWNICLKKYILEIYKMSKKCYTIF